MNRTIIISLLSIGAWCSSCAPDDLPCNGEGNDVMFDLMTDIDSARIPYSDKEVVRFFVLDKYWGFQDTLTMFKRLDRKTVTEQEVIIDDNGCPTVYWNTRYEYIYKATNLDYQIYLIFDNYHRVLWDNRTERKTEMYINASGIPERTFQMFDERDGRGDIVNRRVNDIVNGVPYDNVIRYKSGNGIDMAFVDTLGLVYFADFNYEYTLVP